MCCSTMNRMLRPDDNGRQHHPMPPPPCACHQVVMQPASNGKQPPPSCTRSFAEPSRSNGSGQADQYHYAEIYMNSKLLAVAIAASLGSGVIPLAAAAQSQASGGSNAELTQLQA